MNLLSVLAAVIIYPTVGGTVVSDVHVMAPETLVTAVCLVDEGNDHLNPQNHFGCVTVKPAQTVTIPVAVTAGDGAREFRAVSVNADTPSGDVLISEPSKQMGIAPDAVSPIVISEEIQTRR